MNDDMIMVSRKPVHPGEFLREDYMPELGLTDMGLVDVLEHKLIPVVLE